MNKLDLYKCRDTLSLFEASCLMAGLTPNDLAYGVPNFLLDGEIEQRECLSFLRQQSSALMAVSDAYILPPKRVVFKEVDSWVYEVEKIREILINFNIKDKFFNPNSINAEQGKAQLDVEKQQAKGLNINETRIQAFKFWVAGKGGAEKVERMKKSDVWKELQKIDPRLFSSGDDAFFNNNKTKQNIVIFNSGIRSN